MESIATSVPVVKHILAVTVKHHLIFACLIHVKMVEIVP